MEPAWKIELAGKKTVNLPSLAPSLVVSVLLSAEKITVRPGDSERQRQSSVSGGADGVAVKWPGFHCLVEITLYQGLTIQAHL